jgi:hypothetical protein
MDKMIDTVELLLANGCNANHPGTSSSPLLPLLLLIFFSSLSPFSRIIDAKTPPIMYASMFNSKPGNTLQIVKLLVKHGAVVNAAVILAFYGNQEILDFLETVKVT